MDRFSGIFTGGVPGSLVGTSLLPVAK